MAAFAEAWRLLVSHVDDWVVMVMVMEVEVNGKTYLLDRGHSTL